MNQNGKLGTTIQALREKARLSQADLARRLPFTASRISRLESGELALDSTEAGTIAEAIGTPEARAFAQHLGRDWRFVSRPAFDHPSADALWRADQALQRLAALKDDPELKNAFLKQIESCQASLEQSAAFLESVEHPVAFFGSPGVGKTTAICAMTEDLRDWSEQDLNRQMALQTGSGRVTICEVHVRRGGGFAISIDPCSDEELRHHVSDFCEYLINQNDKRAGRDTSEGAGISAEMERTLRNMTELTIKKVKTDHGKVKREDPAAPLVAQYPDKQELQVEILSRLNAARRRKTSITYPKALTTPPLKWLSRTFAEINFGRHPEFSLPRRIEISIPGDVLDVQELDARLIDTRGIDEPSAPRRDLQGYLDDERTVVVLCSRFEDAPSAAVQAVIERAKEGGLRNGLLQRGMLLILPKEDEERGVLSESTGRPVDDVEEGRDIRLEQVRSTTLADLAVPDLPIEFLNVRSREDCDRIRAFIRSRITEMRTAAEQRLNSLGRTVDNLIENKANEQLRAVFEHAINPIRNWLTNNRALAGEMPQVSAALLEEIDGLRYVASLRASVNRHGDWYNFDYWHGLGFGARREVVARSKEQVTKLTGIVENAINDPELTDAHNFLEHFAQTLEESTTNFFVDVQQLGETAFSEQLRGDPTYWQQCQQRWGQGSGYRTDIRQWTDGWFDAPSRKTRHQFIEAEIQRRWAQMIDSLANKLASPA